jgi:hypothetical protein
VQRMSSVHPNIGKAPPHQIHTPSASRDLVFTSAGDRARIGHWLKGRQNFDLWVTYYGDEGDRFDDLATIYNRRKGSKFQNLLHAYRTWPSLIARYDAVLVMDDDIRLDATAISRLFEIRERHDLWALQPAFSPWGKVSHAITCVNRGTRTRFTNYVEVTCPLFRRDKLEAFLDVYDPVLVGFGVDRWFLHSLGALERKVAIVDEVVCVNPHDVAKGGQREIDRLQAFSERLSIWRRVKAQYGITTEEAGEIEYSAIPRAWPARLTGRLTAAPERGAARLWAHACRAAAKVQRMTAQYTPTGRTVDSQHY